MVIGFEVGGALGRKGWKAERFLAECVRVAEWKNQGVGDLAHWSSMTWGGIGDSGSEWRSLGV